MSAASPGLTDAQAFERPNQRWVHDRAHPDRAAELAKAAGLPQVLAELLGLDSEFVKAAYRALSQ